MTRCPKCGHGDSDAIGEYIHDGPLLRDPGFIAGLTIEQRKRALQYRGPDNFGQPPQPTLWQRFKSWCARVSA
jgi:hypothetical protein